VPVQWVFGRQRVVKKVSTVPGASATRHVYL
jgi:hypothetical protein